MKKYFLLICFCLPFWVSAKTYDVKNYGAKGDGMTLNSIAIQKAIDAAFNAGGGTVVLANGVFLSGTIYLKSNINLKVAQNAVLLGSTNFYDYQKNRWFSLIIAESANNITISGKGTIDGQGRVLAKNIHQLVLDGKIKDKLELNRPHESWRPQLVELSNCRNVNISNVTMKNGSGWLQTYIKCENLKITNTITESTSYWNNDGMDIVDCKNVTVKGCNVNSADDGICFKSFDPNYTSSNLKVKNCKIRTSASGIKFGTASYGGFKDVEISDIFCFDNYRTVIAIESVDGGTIENIDIRNIKGRNVGGAFFIRLGQRRLSAGKLKNISITNMDVEVAATKPDAGYENEGPILEDIFPHNTLPSSIVGMPNAYIDGLQLKNLKINYLTSQPATFISSPNGSETVPLFIKAYPEFNMFGELPAWGIYLRHAKNLRFKNIFLSLNGIDYRSAVFADTVDNLNVDKFKLTQPGMTVPFKLSNVKNFTSSGINLPDTYRGNIVEHLKKAQ